MDFKSLMTTQISKAKSPVAANSTGATSKYVRRADIEAERQAKYAAEQAKLEQERDERATKKRKLEEDDAEQNAIREAKLKKLAEESKIRREAEEREEEKRRRKRLGLPELPEPQEKGAGHEEAALPADVEDVPDDELRSKLRALNEPVSRFDESHTARLKRYYALTDPTALTRAPQMSTGPIPTTLSTVPESSMQIVTTDPPPENDKPALTHLYTLLASYFTLLLTSWTSDLSSRPAEVKDSKSGRAALQSYQIVLADLTPLYRKLESHTLPRDLLPPLLEIVSHMQKREYVKANDAYLRLSIGKAAWPIGVTMVGIHERSAREKLHEGDKMAHIMSDEVTRKMLQSVKRCISYAQVRWPPDDLGQLMG